MGAAASDRHGLPVAWCSSLKQAKDGGRTAHRDSSPCMSSPLRLATAIDGAWCETGQRDRMAAWLLRMLLTDRGGNKAHEKISQMGPAAECKRTRLPSADLRLVSTSGVLWRLQDQSSCIRSHIAYQKVDKLMETRDEAAVSVHDEATAAAVCRLAAATTGEAAIALKVASATHQIRPKRSRMHQTESTHNRC